MLTIAFEAIIYRGVFPEKSVSRVVLFSEGDQTGQPKSDYVRGDSEIVWNNPFKNPIKLPGVAGSARIPIALRQKAHSSRWGQHGRNVAMYYLDLDSDCDSKTFTVKADHRGVDSSSELSIIVTLTGLTNHDTTRRSVLLMDSDGTVNRNLIGTDASPSPSLFPSPSVPVSTSTTVQHPTIHRQSPMEPNAAISASHSAAPGSQFTIVQSSTEGDGRVTSAPDRIPIGAIFARDSPTSSPAGSIHEGYESAAHLQSAAEAEVRDAANQRWRVRSRSLPFADAGIAQSPQEMVSDLKGVYEAMDGGVSRLNALVNIIDIAANIHPLVKGVWSLFSATYTLLQQQAELDGQVVKLVWSLEASCEFAGAIGRNDMAPAADIILRKLLQEILNGATLVKEYCIVRKSAGSAFKFAGSNTASKVDACLEILRSFRLELRDHVAIGIQRSVQDLASAITTHLGTLDKKFERVERHIQAQDDKALLDKMPFAPQADRALRHDTGGCLPGTRVEVLDAIIGWCTGGELADENPYLPDLKTNSRVLWLCGVAGSGKTSIAISVARTLRSMNRLGALYAFETAQQKSFEPTNLFSTIARQRAERRPAYKRHLLAFLRNLHTLDPDQIASTSATKQFRNLLASLPHDDTFPSEDIIVIDAFDESGSRKARRDALRALTPSSKTSNIPVGLRFIITSRYDDDIATELEALLNSNDTIISVLQMHDIEHAHTERDIQLYVDSMLHNLRGLDGCEERVARLAATAEGSFQWASVACRYIANFDDADAASPPAERLADMLSTRGRLDELYLSILDASFLESAGKDRIALRVVLGSLVYSQEPVSVMIINALSSADAPVEHLDLAAYHAIVRKLSSIIVRTQDTSHPLLPFHTSFTDFLQDAERSKPYTALPLESHLAIALGSLKIMKRLLRFNICRLETSFLPNDRIRDLSDRIQNHVPAELSYASRYWIQHAGMAFSLVPDPRAPVLRSLRLAVSDFLRNKMHVLNWLEVISLTDSSAMQSLRTLHLRPSVFSTSDESDFARDLSDLIKFTTHFTIPLRTSTPHIYISALAFAPSSSFSSMNADFPNLIRSEFPTTSWPQVSHSFSHDAPVLCVADSPDGRWLATGLKNGEIHVWDLHLGSKEGFPMIAGTTVNSLAFSPDGAHLVSSSTDEAIRIWDARTWTAVGAPLSRHTGIVGAVAFSNSSKDQPLLASGSSDGTIRIWDALDWKPLGMLLAGHTGLVTSIAFSPNGLLLASGSGDRTVRIWDVRTRLAVGEPLTGNSGWVNSVSFSPDGKCLTVGSESNIIRIWDVQTRTVAVELVAGHRGPVFSVAFSPDGKSLAGSNDKNVHLWHVNTWSHAGEPLVGHNSPVRSVTFSVDGHLLMSASDDQTARIWDVPSILNDSVVQSDDSTPSLPHNAPPKSMSLPLIDSLPPLAPNSLVNLDNGWLLGPNKELIVWIPPSLRPSQLSAREIAQLGHVSQNQLDFTKFVCGPHWESCYSPVHKSPRA